MTAPKTAAPHKGLGKAGIDELVTLVKQYNAIMNPKLAEKQDEMAIQSYISQKLAPFDDYQSTEKDKEAVAKYIAEKFTK